MLMCEYVTSETPNSKKYFIILLRVALALLSLYKVSVTSRVADVEDFRTDMKRFVQNVARHCTVEKLLEAAFLIPMATRRELNLLFNANKDSLMQKGVSIHQKRLVNGEIDTEEPMSSISVRRTDEIKDERSLFHTTLYYLGLAFLWRCSG